MLKSLPVVAFQPDLRSDQQKVDALLEQYSAERDIQLAANPASEIEARLATLRDAGVRPNCTPYLNELHDIDSSDEEMQVNRLTRKIMDEVAIEYGSSTSEIPKMSGKKPQHPRILKHMDRGTPLHASTPELSFCLICLAKATKRCLDCEGGDLYCDKCFVEIHRDWSETHHRGIAYKPRALTTSEDDTDTVDDDDS